MGRMKDWLLELEEKFLRDHEQEGPFECECPKCCNDIDDLCDECKDEYCNWVNNLNKMNKG